MKQQLAYLDEFGDSSFDFANQNTSSHFIITAIIIDQEIEKSLEKELDLVRIKHFQTGEIKSSKVSDNDERRLKILTDFDSLDYKIYSLIVDKKKLYGQGFRYKQSFYKKLHSIVDRELFKLFPNLQITADEHGSTEFMTGFVSYIKKNHIPDLFDQSGFRFIDSHGNLTVQLADFISGTLARCFDERKKSKKGNSFIKLLKPKILDLYEWPINYTSPTYDINKSSVDFSSIITEISLNLAKQIISQKENSKTPVDIDQVNCLKYLLFYFLQINSHRFISTFEIRNHIEVGRIRPMSIHYFRSKVIAKLRDQGALISSSPAGYKLPANEKDLYEFINQSNTTIAPMIERISKCRDRIKIVTKNKLDILDKPEYHILKNIVNYKKEL